MTDCSILQQIKPPSHIGVMYYDKEKLANVLSDFINTGLENDQLCYIGSIDIDLVLFKSLVNKIRNFDESLQNGNLIISILGDYKMNVLNDDFNQFQTLKKFLERRISRRKEKFVRVIGDLASAFFYEKKYEQWQTLEKIWQEKPFEGCYVCPYDINKMEQNSEKRTLLNSLHDDIVYCENPIIQQIVKYHTS